jgi:hypothetical protein
MSLLPSPSLPPSPNSINLIKNSGFESGQLSPWHFFGDETVDEAPISSLNPNSSLSGLSAQGSNVNGQPGLFFQLSQDVDLIGTTSNAYRREFWGYQEKAGNCRMYVRWLSTLTVNDYFDLGQHYAKQGVDFTNQILGSVATVVIKMMCTNGGAVTRVFLDDITLVERI